MKFRELKEGERRVLVLRHGTSEPDKDQLPIDTISDGSYQQIARLGSHVRIAGLRVTKVVSSPRGRAVISGFAFAEGNARVGESVVPFQTNDDLTDISSVRPEIVARLKAITESRSCTTEQAILLTEDVQDQNYLYRRAGEYAQVFISAPGDTLLAAHGGLADVAIVILQEHTSYQFPGYRLSNLGQPTKWLNKGQAVELILNANGKLVEVNYLE